MKAGICLEFWFLALLGVKGLKWYYDQNITFIFSSDFETLSTKHSQGKFEALISTRRLFI